MNASIDGRSNPGFRRVLFVLIITSIGLLLCRPGLFIPPAAAAQGTTEQGAPLRVVIREIAPFVLRDGAVYTGFSIDLWKEIAARTGLAYEFTEATTVRDQISAIRFGEADVAIAAISMTPEREDVVDFSYPFLISGLQIMTAVGGASLWDRVQGFFSLSLLQTIGWLVLLMSLAAHIIWLVERRVNPDFPHSYLAGIWEAVWWAAVTVATVGYGDKTPRSLAGRLIAMIWMFAGLFVLANFTAAITSHITLQELRGAIRGIDDLPGKQVISIEGSTAKDYLTRAHISHRTVIRIEDAYQRLEQGTVQALVYDASVLQHYAATDGRGKVQLVGPVFQQEYYGIAFPEGSPLREQVNQALLEIRSDGTYQALHQRWFGVLE